MTQKAITIYHSPDADDAFMFFGLTSGVIEIPGYSFSHDLSDIETLNRRAMNGELDVTAVSVHAIPFLNDNYAVLDCGASMGEAEYGPRLVARESFHFFPGRHYNIALPGQYTSTALAMNLFLRMEKIEASIEHIPFNEVQQKVADGEFDCGAIIHEGQITYEKLGLSVVLDFGKWWWEKYQLPLPLGVNVARKAIGMDKMRTAARALKESIDYALSHREEAINYALKYARGLSYAEADAFVEMYVNERTRSLGEEGKRSIELFLSLGVEYGLVPRISSLEYVHSS